jgi:aconitate hydratase/homoaconitate hydratase
VAASSVGMTIADPRRHVGRVDRDRLDRILGQVRGRRLPDIEISEPRPPAGAAAEGTAPSGATAAPERLTGRVARFGDHVDTDAIIPGEFCHLTSLADLGARCFHHVRPDFVARVAAGEDIVVAGEAWGSGSSREQAVWALQGAGVKAVIARSFAFIHKRNLVNEALPFLIVEDPEFYEQALTGAEVSIDFARSEVQVAGRSYRARGASPMIQALTKAGGLVPAIQRYGNDVFGALAGGA